MAGRLQDKVAIVTGASRGIGRAIAVEFAREGAHVCVNYNQQSGKAAEVVSEIEVLGRKAIAVQADVSNAGQVQAMVQQTISDLGPIDILVNNAGVETIIPFLEMTEEQWWDVVRVNSKGEWLCAQTVAKAMVERGRGGAIINVGSVQAGKVMPGRTHYAPAKLGLVAFTRNAAYELAEHGIRVNCIHPGLIETDLTQWVMARSDLLPGVLERIPLHRVGIPREVATAVVFLASDDASYVTGQSLFVDAGMAFG